MPLLQPGRPLSLEVSNLLDALWLLLGQAKATGCFVRACAQYAAPILSSWKYYIEELWWSGLRLAESLELHWTDPTRLRVDLSERYAMLSIPAELEKGHKDRLPLWRPNSPNSFCGHLNGSEWASYSTPNPNGCETIDSVSNRMAGRWYGLGSHRK